jgi:hypothetical protein
MVHKEQLEHKEQQVQQVLKVLLVQPEHKGQ